MLSIFDIPLIIDAICDSLELSDIWSCYRVNKTWRCLFGPHRYKTIQFAYLDPYQTWDILNKAHRIRRLQIDLADAGYFINAPCTQLRELVCMDMGYLWRSDDDNDDDDDWPFPPEWKELEPSVNALSLIGTNPNLRTLELSYRSWMVRPDPFSKDIFASLSSHQSLREISISLVVRLGFFRDLLINLPKSLQRLDLSVHFDRHGQLDHVPSPIQLSQPTQLRYISFPVLPNNTEDALLIPVLKQSPLLEHIVIRQVAAPVFENGVIPALVGHCPNLHSFQHDFGSYEWLTGFIKLLEAYPNGMRRVVLNHRWYFYQMDIAVPESNKALTKALLAHSINTLESLELVGTMDGWVDCIAILEQCPNLKEVQVDCPLSLDDLVRQPLIGMPRSWTGDSMNLDWTETLQAPPALPWACTKLERIWMNIGKPGETYSGGVDLLPQCFRTDDLIEDFATATILQIGILLSTLRSLKCLKHKQIYWNRNVNEAIEPLSFERGVFYMNQMGLRGITQDDMYDMGFGWKSTADCQRAEESEKLQGIAIHERTGLDRVLHEDYYYWNVGAAKDFEMDWPFNVDQKKFHKSGNLYSRRSLRSNAEWFDSRT
ncbi:hypothetical protein B0O80DRAFT_474694 [Mortierella sp. GBAus27b]|nr:hypothetical protein BGX31_000868 [Mortierella sp. GBA43]KAI8345237.1 hypothetical protein B0O80DRAFT_474694 [Mortierella sp. GBAus27b]